MLVSDLPPLAILLLAFVFGALWGSFFNVAIYRWPRDMSVVSPPSHCPACDAPIPAWRNIPIFAFLFQRGKAACCGATMTPRYLLVEVLSALLCTALAQRFIVEAEPHAQLAPLAIETGLWFVFVGGLIIATFVDLEWMEIPDEVSIGGAAIGLVTVTLRSGVTPEDAALGAGAGFLVVQLFLVWAWERFAGRRGMGEGDPKLLMMIGAFLGWRGALFALVGGAMQGVVVYVFGRAAGLKTIGSANEEAPKPDEAKSGDAKPDEAKSEDAKPDEPKKTKKTKKAKHEAAETKSESDGEKAKSDDAKAKSDSEDEDEDDDAPPADYIPFGPLLALGALEYLFFGEPLINWYLSLFE